MVSFISISFFVLLGAAIFLGIDWSVTGFKNTVNNTLEEWNMHDVAITFPYGFSDEEISRISELDYVDKVEGQNSFEANFIYNKNRYQAKVILLTDVIDGAHKIDGEIPKRKGEIGFEKYWAENNGIKVGDTIVFEHDDNGTAYSLYNLLNEDLDALQENSVTEDGMMYLTTDTYKVTGLFENATYINEYKVTYGVSATTSIPNDCITYVSEDSIDLKAFNGYRTLLLTVPELRDLSTFDDEYKEKNKEVVSRLENDLKGYIDETNARISTSINNIRNTINEQIIDGENELEKGRKEIEDGEKKIRNGEKQLADGKIELANAKLQLDDARSTLDNGWKQYNSGVEEFNAGKAEFDKIDKTFTSIQDTIEYFKLLGDFGSKFASYYETYIQTTTSIKTLLDSYQSGVAIEQFFEDFSNGAYNGDAASIAANVKNTFITIRNIDDFKLLKEAVLLLDSTDPGVSILKELVLTIDKAEQTEQSLIYIYDLLKDPEVVSVLKPLSKLYIGQEAQEILNFINSIESDINRTFPSSDEKIQEVIRVISIYNSLIGQVENEINSYKPQLDAAKAKLDEADKQLASGYNELRKGEYRYNEGVIEYESGLAEIEKNEKLIKKSKQDIIDAKAKIEDGEKELEIAKNKVKDFDEKVKEIKNYDISSLGRNLNGGVGSTVVPVDMMSSIKYTMVLLFIIVGVFVCYSALSRSVYDQTIQIGTKKALGLTRREVTISFLLYGTFATILGCILGVLLARFVIEPLILNILAKNYIIADNKMYFSLKSSLLFLAFELVVTNLTSYLACNKALKKKAIKLLQGPEDLIGKSHFYEKLPGWNSLSLLNKTIINNCVNDKRRVLSTLVGIAGCCSLMVCAISLITNMNDSLDYQINDIAKFDTIVYVDETVEGSIENINKKLDKINLDHYTVTYSSCAIENSRGDYVTGALFIYDDDSFFDFFDVAIDGNRQAIGDGICVTKAYAQYNNVNVGDYVTILDSVGEKHSIKVTAIFDYYLLRVQTVMNKDSYIKEFGKDPINNSILIKRGNYSNVDINDALYTIDGYISSFDYLDESVTIYSSLTDSVMIIVITFFVLAVVLSFLVLLNLLIMFVDEKKKELIVMMINGYSRKRVKTYIYGDTIFLSVIGVIIGILIGVSVGFATIKTFDSDCVTIMRNINIPSYLLCGLFTGVLSAISCLIALRKVDKFKLTEINSK